MKKTKLVLLLFFICRIAVSQGQPCSGTPLGSGVIPFNDTLCIGSPVTLSISFTYTESGISYQWFSTTNSPNGPFTTIPSATNTIYSTLAYSNPRSYYVNVMCATAGATMTSTYSTIYGVVCTGMKENNLDKDIRMYPVPAHGLVTIELSEPVEIPVTAIYTIDGRKIIFETSTFNDGKLVLNTDGLEKGIYLLEITLGIQKATRLLVVE